MCVCVCVCVCVCACVPSAAARCSALSVISAVHMVLNVNISVLLQNIVASVVDDRGDSMCYWCPIGDLCLPLYSVGLKLTKARPNPAHGRSRPRERMMALQLASSWQAPAWRPHADGTEALCAMAQWSLLAVHDMQREHSS